MTNAGDVHRPPGVPGRRERHRPSPEAPFRLALSVPEVAGSIGVSVDFFDEHVRPELRVVRRGRKVLVPVRKLECWLDRWEDIDFTKNVITVARSWDVKSGVIDPKSQAGVGHTSVMITLDRYGHLLPGNESEAAGLLDDLLSNAVVAEAQC